MSIYTTGEMAKLCGVSVRTVQFYDGRGILHPSELTEGGRRLYGEDDLTRLRLICTLKGMGLSLDSIKGVLESEMSGQILGILLDEQEKTLATEVDARQKQLARIAILKEGIRNEATVPANTIIGIEKHIERKVIASGRRKLRWLGVVVGLAVASQIPLLAWLFIAQIWWALAVYLGMAVMGLGIAALQLRGKSFLCPRCGAAFKPPLLRAFFTPGDHKVRWITCPACGRKDWCVLR